MVSKDECSSVGVVISTLVGVVRVMWPRPVLMSTWKIKERKMTKFSKGVSDKIHIL